jgi:hypothetical protein
MARPLGDVQEHIEGFISAAAECASRGNGFSALLTVFPVILSVAEAVYFSRLPKPPPSAKVDDIDLFKLFVPEMQDYSWLTRRGGKQLSPEAIADDLCRIRNDLSHQLSMPPHILLVNTIADARKRLSEGTSPGVHIIAVVEFVVAAGATARLLIDRHTVIAFDPNPKRTRGPAKGTPYPDGTSASRAS